MENSFDVFSSGREPSIEDKWRLSRALWKKRASTLQSFHEVHLGDAQRTSTYVAGRAVHLVLTSPPYWNLKKYAGGGNGSQLGHIQERDAFLATLRHVWAECFNVLTEGGKMCVVVGDVCRSRRKHGRHVVEPLHAYIQVQCQELGFDPLALIIWNKIANVSREVQGNGGGFLGKPYEPNAVIKNDIEYILVFRKPGEYRHPTKEQRLLSLLSKEDYQTYFRQIWSDIPGDIQRHHPAPYPAKLAERLIRMYSFVGDTVLDPFWGTGSTTRAAMDNYRSSIGIELEPSYVRKSEERFNEIGMTLEYFWHES